MRSISTLNPVLARRLETAELVRDRMSYLLGPGSGPARAAPADPPDPAPDSGPGPDSGPDPGPSRHRLRLRLPHSVPPLDRRAVLGLAALLLLAVAYAVQHFWLGRPQAVAVPAVPAASLVGTATVGAARAGAHPPAPGPGDAPAPSAPAVVVDIAGKVANPGLRSLPGGSRVADAVRVAGGALPGVDTDGLNLARVLVDGEQILVGAPSPPQAAAGPRPPVSLNHGTLEQLDALPGVGPVLAQHIVDFRVSHAGFRSLDQLRQISGIGDRKLAELKQLVTL